MSPSQVLKALNLLYVISFSTKPFAVFHINFLFQLTFNMFLFSILRFTRFILFMISSMIKYFDLLQWTQIVIEFDNFMYWVKHKHQLLWLLILTIDQSVLIKKILNHWIYTRHFQHSLSVSYLSLLISGEYSPNKWTEKWPKIMDVV